jgi:hypothetical protein
VGLIVQVQAIGDQFFDFDLRRAFEGTSAAGTAAFSPVPSPVVRAALVRAPVLAAPTLLRAASAALRASWRAILAARPLFSFARLRRGRLRLFLLARLRRRSRFRHGHGRFSLCFVFHMPASVLRLS